MTTTVVTPHAWTANVEYTTATNLGTLTDAISQVQGGTPAAGALDFCHARQTVVQSIPTATWTSVTMDVEDVDKAGGHTTTSRYTVQTDGWFDVRAAVAWANTSGGRRIIRLALNGSPVPGSGVGGTVNVSATSYAMTVTDSVHANAGDYIEVQCFQDSGNPLNTYVVGAGESASRLFVKFESTY